MKIPLDKFYTLSVCAEWCFNQFKTTALTDLAKRAEEMFYIEPAVGAGAFYKLLPRTKAGFDIDIKENRRDGIRKRDFLTVFNPYSFSTAIKATSDRVGRLAENAVLIGNPPFGKRGRTAIKFFHHGARMANTIAFILPVSFDNYHTQRQLPDGWKLIYSQRLPDESFELPNGAPYAVRTVFQVWTKLHTSANDLRKQRAPTSHKDFVMLQYNNTKAALKHFDAPFDFAVPCQGYQDYNRRETNEKNCERKVQWLIFRAKNDEVLARLLNIDFEALALTQTVTPGFRKHNVVEEYKRIKRG